LQVPRWKNLRIFSSAPPGHSLDPRRFRYKSLKSPHAYPRRHCSATAGRLLPMEVEDKILPLRAEMIARQTVFRFFRFLAEKNERSAKQKSFRIFPTLGIPYSVVPRIHGLSTIFLPSSGKIIRGGSRELEAVSPVQQLSRVGPRKERRPPPSDTNPRFSRRFA
jgi:hypothetical protein